jgi:hypothetical protein
MSSFLQTRSLSEEEHKLGGSARSADATRVAARTATHFPYGGMDADGNSTIYFPVRSTRLAVGRRVGIRSAIADWRILSACAR